MNSIPTNTDGPQNASKRRSPKSASKGKTPRLETIISHAHLPELSEVECATPEGGENTGHRVVRVDADSQ